MKKLFILLVFGGNTLSFAVAQDIPADTKKKLSAVIDQYSIARETRDTVLLKKILTTDIDQSVSTGEWRSGIRTAVAGMMRSSAVTQGTRTLTIEKMRMLAPTGSGLDTTSAIVDCRYEIKNDDGTTRKMWSTFVLVSQKGTWRISAIRNMLPSAQ